MTAVIDNLLIEQGTTYRHVFPILSSFYDQTISPVGEGNYKARMQIRRYYNSEIPLLDITSDDSIALSETEAVVELSAAQTALLTWTGYAVFDIELYDPTVSPEYVTRMYQGNVRLSLETTKVVPEE